MVRSGVLWFLTASVILQLCLAAHRLDITPSVFELGLTKQVDLKCAFTKDLGMDVKSLLSLELSVSPFYSPVGSITADTNQLTGDILKTAAIATGKIDNSGESSIAVTWFYPDKTVAGRYRCRATFSKTSGQIVQLDAYAELGAQSPTIGGVVDEIGNLNKLIYELISKWSDFTDYQKNRLNVTASLRTQFEVSEPFRSRRYYLNTRTHYFTANDAHFRCHMYGGYLAEIDDAEEFDFVRNFLMAKNPRFYEILLGGSDEAQEKNWVFPYSNRPVTYFNWTAGQPDAGRGANNQCIWRDGRYFMSDCVPLMTYDWSYLCEIPIVYDD